MSDVTERPTQRTVVIIVKIVLFLLVSYLIFNTTHLINRNNGHFSSLGHPETTVNFSLLAYDDPELLNFIRTDYLNPPANRTERNLTAKVGKNSITSVVMQLLGNKSNGFFIEAGANDGESISNSLSLEVFHNWSGLLVEADPAPLKKLLRTKRSSWVAKCCLSPFNHAAQINMITHMRWNGIGNIPYLYQENKGPITKGDFSEPFAVQCFPLYSLLLAIGQTSVDYMSLDIEGAEFEILKTIPFDKVSFKVISVEVNQKAQQVMEFLKMQGYISVDRVREPYVDDVIFVRTDLLQSSTITA